MQKTDSFLALAEHYDAFLCDLWGVIHDGLALYPGVAQTLQALHEKGRKLIFLSNAPRTKEAVTRRLDHFGIQPDWYSDAISSGAAAIRFLNEDWRNFGQMPGTPKKDVPNTVAGRGLFYFAQPQLKCYYLGLEQDADLVDFIPQTAVSTLEEADFLLNSNFETLFQPMEEITPLLDHALALKLPMLCINPDIEVVRQDGTHILCAGHLADYYRRKGGEVEQIGKPYPLVYDYALRELLKTTPRERILMVGDNLHTDILGAMHADIDSVLITGGVLKEVLKPGDSVEEYCRKLFIEPTWLAEKFGS